MNIRDWATLGEPKVLPEEAHVILAELNTGELKISLKNFRQGLEVELEHGIRFPEANVTNNHPILTGQIVLAHFKESLDYYQSLEVAEIEGDLLKAVVDNDASKVEALYKKLIKAKLTQSNRIRYVVTLCAPITRRTPLTAHTTQTIFFILQWFLIK